MAKTFHEYDHPNDQTVHWHDLLDEVRADAAITTVPARVTCKGCLAWLKRFGNKDNVN